MSYSFTIRAATKEQAKQVFKERFEFETARQPAHNTEKQQALSAVNAFIDLLDEDLNQDVVVNVYGSVIGTWSEDHHSSVRGANIGISAHLAIKEMVDKSLGGLA